MARLAGEWGEPTITGPRRIVVDGREFGAPVAAAVKIVKTRFGAVAHVRIGSGIGSRVVVLSSLGQLRESEQEALLRATPKHWAAIHNAI